MSSRRTFFRTLGLTGGAIAAAQVSKVALAALPEIATTNKAATAPPLVPREGGRITRW